jgi:hypothetical protein
MTKAPGFNQTFDLAALGDEDRIVVLRPGASECAAVAEWLGVSAVEMLEAEVRLSRKDLNSYRYDARFAADVVQACVVTLQPVHSRLEGAFHRLYQVFPRGRRSQPRGSSRGAISLSDDEEPETIETTLIDIAEPVLEELSPYPRAPGVAFEAPAEQVSPGDRPFAVLEALKPKLTPGEEGGESAAVKNPPSKRRDR